MTAVNGISSNAYYELQRLQGGVSKNTVYQTEDGNLFNTNGYAVSASGETCTDGKDDGKIGFGSALWNTIKGVGKTAVNMVKGCFTGKDGKFSLGKTLLTAATAAVCVAFPAVGLVACGVGAVAGGVQVAKGVYNAATADTDAEAKEAWQQVGGGALTTGLSIAGAKASYGALKSSAGGANSALAKYDNPTTGKLDFSQVKNNKLQFAKDLFSDMKTSTVNRANSIGEAASNAFTNAKSAIKDSKATQTLKNAAKDPKATAKSVNESVKDGASKATDAVKNAVKDPKAIARSLAESTKTLFEKVSSKITKENISEVASKLKGAPRAIANKIAEGKTSLDQLVSQYGYDNVIEVLEILGAAESI